MCARLDRHRPGRRPGPDVPHQLGDRGGRGRHQARPRLTRGRQYLIAFVGAFHGRSYGSVSLTASKAKYHAGLRAAAAGRPARARSAAEPAEYHRARSSSSGWSRRARSPPSSSSPSRARAGTSSRPTGWLAELRELCTEHGILLVADEIQSGMGRTGRMWAVEHGGVEPGHRAGRQGHRQRHAAGGDDRPRRPHDVGRGRPRLDLRREPRLLCAAALATIDLLERRADRERRRTGGVLLDGLAASQAGSR